MKLRIVLALLLVALAAGVWLLLRRPATPPEYDALAAGMTPEEARATLGRREPVVLHHSSTILQEKYDVEGFAVWLQFIDGRLESRRCIPPQTPWEWLGDSFDAMARRARLR